MFLIAGLLLSVPSCMPSVPSCSCVRVSNSSSEESPALGNYAAVFEGTVVRINTVRDSVVVSKVGGDVRVFRWTDLVVTFVVDRQWKGDRADSTVVRTAEQTTACGADFSAGGRYLVFSSSRGYSGLGDDPPAKVGEVTFTDKCSPTTHVGVDADRLIRKLGPGKTLKMRPLGVDPRLRYEEPNGRT
jgi:hypothetical protein